MKSRLPFQTLRGQLTLWFLLLAALPLLLFGAVIYRQQSQAIREEAGIKLAAVRDLKVERITAWMSEFAGDIESIIAYNREILLPGGSGSLETNAATLGYLRTVFNNHIRHHGSFSDLSVIDPRTARIIVSSTGKYEGESVATSPNFLEPLRTKKPSFREVHLSDLTGARRMNIVVPLVVPGPEAVVAAIFVADIDMNLFDKLLQERAGTGDTGETLVVNRDAVALNQLRYHENAPLRLKLTGGAAILAAEGKTGVIEAKDYRGVPIVAAYTFIPSVGWGFVAKQDQAEIYEPIAALLKSLTILLYLLVPLIVVIFSNLTA